MIPLYAKLMAPVYGSDLGHTQRDPIDPERSTFACFMWWDVIPLYGGMDHDDRDRINDAVLNIFEQVLKLRAESCLESVLHGLGHWHLYVPERTEPIVRKFLTRTDISPQLRVTPKLPLLVAFNSAAEHISRAKGYPQLCGAHRIRSQTALVVTKLRIPGSSP